MSLDDFGGIETFGAKSLEGLDMSHAEAGKRVRGNARQFVRFFNHTYSEIFTKRAKVNEKTGATTILEKDVRPVTKEFVQIITPGDAGTEIFTMAEDYHKNEHFAEYRAFREGRVAPTGRPIDECAYISQPVVTELKVKRVFTEEQLASASDVLCEQIPDGFALRENARCSAKANELNANPAMLVLQKDLAEAMKMIRSLQGGVVAKEPVVTEEVKEVKAKGRPKKNLGPVNLKVE